MSALPSVGTLIRCTMGRHDYYAPSSGPAVCRWCGEREPVKAAPSQASSRRRQRSRVGLSLGVWAALALIWWLDSPASPLALHGAPETRQAGVVAAIVTVIEIFAGWVATAAEITAAYVWVALQWLGGNVATMLRNTGSMFAKVWDAGKIVWSDALKPALLWVDDKLTRFYSWLQGTFKPVFDFLREIRTRLMAFYDTFVRPVIDTIEFIRQINRVLLAFHINLLQQLDTVLQQIETRIEEPIQWINEKLNEVWGALELVVTADGFFQRLTLIRSMSRYAPNWMNGFWNRQIGQDVKAGDDYSRTRDYPSDSDEANGLELARFYRGEPSRMDGTVGGLIPIFRVAAGIDPPNSEPF